jgi:hypothetical protein
LNWKDLVLLLNGVGIDIEGGEVEGEDLLVYCEEIANIDPKGKL